MVVKRIDAVTLKSWLDKDEAVLVDVREPAEYASAHIAGATLLPLANVKKSALPNYTNKKLVLHCRKGGRGASACEKLLAEDAEINIYNLTEGTEGWSKAGLPLECSGRFFLPLDQQVRLIIGVGVLLGSTLGYFVNPLFFILSAFFGAGLIFAGLTGTCTLALLIAKAPWNHC